MIAVRLKGWRSAGVAAVLGLAACGGEAGEAGERGQGGEAGEASEAAAPAPAAAAAGGEAGEAGAASAYAGLSGDQLTALRLQHLRGFLMAAAAVNDANQPAEAAVLVQQGLLEVYDPAPVQFADLDVAIVRSAANSSLDRAQLAQAIRAAETELERASSALDIDHAVLTARMVDIATGLYQGVVQEDFVDPIEYQHSMGAALAARDALNDGREALRQKDARAYAEAKRELDRLAELWPQATAPERPATYGQVLAQASRVRLALSPFL